MNSDAVSTRSDLMFEKLMGLLHKVHVVMCADPVNLKEAARPVVTIEAEYGDAVVAGEVLTMAHHGPRQDQPAPCITPVEPGLARKIVQDAYGNRTVGLSHTDLDSVGGLLRILESHPDLRRWQLGTEEFWDLAAYADTHGAHHVEEYRATDENVQQLWAWWAWERENPCYPPKDGSIADVNDWMVRAVTVLAQIFGVFGKPAETQRLNAGERFRLAEEKLSRDTFISLGKNGCATRVAPEFVNHLYKTPEGPARAIVAYNTQEGSITVSRESDAVRFNVRELVQKLWGPEAGGHAGIAGSPRSRRMSLVEFLACVDAVERRLE